MNCRIEGAITVVRDAISTASSIPADSIGIDDDLVNDLALDELEQESLRLILEEIFSVTIPGSLWRTPLHRTAAAMAEGLIGASDQGSWAEARRHSGKRKYG